MKTTNKAAALLFAVILSAASQGALADEHPCAVEVGAVETAIDNAVFNAGNGPNAGKDQRRMKLKVQEAISKLVAEKYDDAVQKLVDISVKAEDLAESPKQKLEDDTEIQTSIYEAVVCINGL